MRRLLFLAILLALVLLAPTVAAIPLIGRLQWEDPALVSGALAFGPGSTESVAQLKVDPDSTAPTGPLVRADSVRLILHHWDSNTVVTGKVPAPLPEMVKDRQIILEVTQASLTLEQLTSQPQILVLGAPGAPPPAMSARASATQCSVQNPGKPDHFVYPDDNASLAEQHWKEGSQGERQLSAACRIHDFTTQTPNRIYLYGMRLVLESNECRDVIETGTYDESAPSAPEALCRGSTGAGHAASRMRYARATQILELQHLGAPILTHLLLNSTLRVYSEEFLAIGEMNVAPSRGELTWGPDTHRGSIRAFTAEGEFQMRANEDRFVRLDGNTVTHPQAAPVDANAPSSAPLALPLAATFAAIGLAALLARGLWTLFARLNPERLLTHPRRAKILDFVTREPGVDAVTISRSLGIRPAKVHYHLQRLAIGGHLTIRRLGMRLALFSTPSVPLSQALKVALLRRATPGQVHALLASEPGLDQESIARRLGITQSHVSRSLRSLVQAGLVGARVEDRRRRYTAVPP